MSPFIFKDQCGSVAGPVLKPTHFTKERKVLTERHDGHDSGTWVYVSYTLNMGSISVINYSVNNCRVVINYSVVGQVFQKTCMSFEFITELTQGILPSNTENQN